MKMRLSYFSLVLILLFTLIQCKEQPKTDTEVTSEEELVKKALAIHKQVLTLDTHADTPLRMIQPGFDMGVKHDPKETGSKVDYPRMVEGDLDAIFFAAFVAQEIRDDDGHSRAKALCLQMIDSIIASTN